MHKCTFMLEISQISSIWYGGNLSYIIRMVFSCRENYSQFLGADGCCGLVRCCIPRRCSSKQWPVPGPGIILIRKKCLRCSLPFFFHPGSKRVNLSSSLLFVLLGKSTLYASCALIVFFIKAIV